MNKPQGSRNLLKMTLLTCSFMASIVSNAQIGYEISSPFYHYNSNFYRYNSPWPHYHGNDCSRFFLDSAKGINAKFKSVTVKCFNGDDSIMTNKKFDFLCRFEFSDKGKITFEKKTDSIGKTTDSNRYFYNNDGKLVKLIEYSNEYSNNGSMQLVESSRLFWDDQGNLLLDSTLTKKNEYYRNDTAGYARQIYKYTYDSYGYEKSRIYITNDTDSTASFYIYDDRERVIEEKFYRNKAGRYSYHKNKWNYNFYKYDGAGRMIQKIEVEEDTTLTRYYRDADERILKEEIFVNGVLHTRYVTDFLTEGYRKTIDRFGVQRGGSCTMNEHTVTLYDKDSNELSSISTEDRSGKLSTYKTTHYYSFYGRHILSDSVVSTDEEERFKSCNTLELFNYAYDAAGHKIEEHVLGENNEDKRETWAYNKQNMILENGRYLACEDNPYQRYIFTYFPDNKTLSKEEVSEGRGYQSVKFAEDSKFIEFINYTYDKSYRQLIYEYEK